jgi:hypothetical protein
MEEQKNKWKNKQMKILAVLNNKEFKMYFTLDTRVTLLLVLQIFMSM